jgi:hypothetical protein
MSFKLSNNGVYYTVDDHRLTIKVENKIAFQMKEPLKLLDLSLPNALVPYASLAYFSGVLNKSSGDMYIGQPLIIPNGNGSFYWSYDMRCPHEQVNSTQPFKGPTNGKFTLITPANKDSSYYFAQAGHSYDDPIQVPSIYANNNSCIIDNMSMWDETHTVGTMYNIRCSLEGHADPADGNGWVVFLIAWKDIT